MHTGWWGKSGWVVCEGLCFSLGAFTLKVQALLHTPCTLSLSLLTAEQE